MKKIVIETKISIKRVNSIIRKIYGQNFFSKFKRGQIYVYCYEHISDDQLFQICQELSLEIVSKFPARATLRH